MWCSQVGILAYLMAGAILIGVAILLKRRQRAKVQAAQAE